MKKPITAAVLASSVLSAVVATAGTAFRVLDAEGRSVGETFDGVEVVHLAAG
jgi:hypothetical protein